MCCFSKAAKKPKSKQSSAHKSPQKRPRKSKGGADEEEGQGSLFDIVKAGKGALRVCLTISTHFHMAQHYKDSLWVWSMGTLTSFGDHIFLCSCSSSFYDKLTITYTEQRWHC